MKASDAISALCVQIKEQRKAAARRHHGRLAVVLRDAENALRAFGALLAHLEQERAMQ